MGVCQSKPVSDYVSREHEKRKSIVEVPTGDSETVIVAAKTADAASLATHRENSTLREILLNPAKCESFRNFLKKNSTASDCLLCWLDIEDFRQTPPCEFRDGRAQTIYQRYFMHGANHNVPVGLMITDSVSAAVSGDDVVPSDAFDLAQKEVFEYLHMEVFSEWLKNAPKDFSHDCEGSQSLKFIEPTKIDGYIQKKTELDGIVQDPWYCLSFKTFLDKHNMGEIFMFYLELGDYDQTYESVIEIDDDNLDVQIDPKEERRKRMRFIWMRTHKIYEKYLKLGSRKQVFLSDSTRQYVMQHMAAMKFPNIDSQIFQRAREEVAHYLMQNYLQPFKDSRNFKHVDRSIPSVIEPEGESKVDKADPEATTRCLNLSQIINGGCVQVFQKWLEEKKRVRLLMFHQDVKEFKEIPHVRKAFIAGRAKKIYYKFLRRGAQMEIVISSSERARVLWNLVNPSMSMFDSLLEHVRRVLSNDDHPQFIKSTEYQDYLKAHPEELKQPELTREQSVSVFKMGRQRITIPIQTILNTSDLCRFLLQFLQSEFCPESLLFWLEVEDYKRLPDSAFLKARARKIFNKFLSENAKTPIQVSEEAIATVKDNLLTPKPMLFRETQAEVFNFLESFLFPKFKTSEHYQNLERHFIKTGQTKHVQRASSSVDGSMDIGGCNFQSLNELLDNRFALSYYKNFCEQSLCAENILFFLEVQDYKRIPGSGYVKLRAAKIYKRFIATNAKQEINLPAKVKDKLVENLKNPTSSLFQDAQDEIVHLMTKDTFPKFMKSKEYAKFLQAFRDKKKQGDITIL